MRTLSIACLAFLAILVAAGAVAQQAADTIVTHGKILTVDAAFRTVEALAITNGMRRDLQDRLLGASAHIDLMRVASDGIKDWPPLLARLKQVPHVTAAAPGLYGQVLVSRGPRAGFALIKGIIPADERTVSNLLDFMVQGSAKDLDPAPTGLTDHRRPFSGRDMKDHDRLVEQFRHADQASERLSLRDAGVTDRVVFRCGVALREKPLDHPCDDPVVLRVDADERLRAPGGKQNIEVV